MSSGWNTTPHRALIRVYTCPESNTTKHLIWKGTLVIQSSGIQLQDASWRQAKSAFKYGSFWKFRWDDHNFLGSSHSITEEQEAFDQFIAKNVYHTWQRNSSRQLPHSVLLCVAIVQDLLHDAALASLVTVRCWRLSTSMGIYSQYCTLWLPPQ